MEVLSKLSRWNKILAMCTFIIVILKSSETMRIFKFPLWIAAVAALVLSFSSCDPLSSVEYNIHNISRDTVSITFHKEIMTSSYRGYDIEENDSVTTHYESDSCIVAVLAPNQHLSIHREWNGLYRVEHVVPAWKYIRSIRVGETEVEPVKWNNEEAWNHRTKGGGNFAKDESHYYDLWFRD